MMNESDALWSFRLAVRDAQDAGWLPYGDWTSFSSTWQ